MEGEQFIPATPPRPRFPRSVLVVLIGIVLTGIVGGIVYWQKREILPPPPAVSPPSPRPAPHPPLPSQPSSPPPPPPITQSSPTQIASVAAKRFAQLENITLEKADVVPKIPEYSLPLAVKDIANYQKFSQKFRLSSGALSLLEKNGFVVIPTPKDIAEQEGYFSRITRKYAYPKNNFAAYYSVLKDKDLPIFVTTDSLLHYYHIFFDTTLMKLERDLFYDDLWQMSKELFDSSLQFYNTSSGDLKEAAKRNVAYFSVALELLKPKEHQVAGDATLREEYCSPGMEPQLCEELIDEMKYIYGEKVSLKYFSKSDLRKYSFNIPSFVQQEVQKELKLIADHKGWDNSPIFIYKEDYSQYVPRGHYTKTEKLKNYFRAMMWYGRMTHLIQGSDQLQKGQSACLNDGIISAYDAKIQTLQAALIANELSQSTGIQEKWQRLYVITAFLVGFSDDLGPHEYAIALDALFQDRISSQLQDIDKKYPEIKNVLSSLPFSPKIYSGLGQCGVASPEQAKTVLRNTKGFRLMGQRLTVDTYLFSKIIDPYSGKYTGNRTPRPFTWVKTDLGTQVRGFPRGLDIMALFGSRRAREILRELGDADYADYEEQFSKLKEEIDSFSTDDWLQNLYWSWIYVLKSLLAEFGDGYQAFMQTQAWQDKELTTALASWAELRHDTILYVKQDSLRAEGAFPREKVKIVGYVEPVPAFYARLLTLSKMTKRGLERLVPLGELEKLKIDVALDGFVQILEKLLGISRKELENKALTEEEYDFINNFGEILEEVVKSVAEGEFGTDAVQTTLVADVHTEGNTEQVLEEGVGNIRTLVAAYRIPDGHILIGVGPTFSYYELKQPMKNRLTDEAWRKLLETNPPPEPEWVKSFSFSGQ